MIIATLSRWQRVLPAGLVAATAAAALLGTAPAASAAPARHLHFVTVNVPGALGTQLAAINNNGVLAGSYQTIASTKGFIMAGSKITRFSYPGAFETFVSGINDQGAVVGQYFGSNNASGAFLRSPSGHLTALTDPHAAPNGTFARGINDHGAVVGGYVDSRGVAHGFLYQSGQFTTIDVPHGFYGRATFGSAISAINDTGSMVGSYTPSGKIGANEGYLDSAGQFTPLAGPAPRTFPTDDIEANGISNTGVIAGFSRSARGVAHGWLLSGQQYTMIDDPLADNHPNPNGGAGTSPGGINEHGVVVGSYWDNGGVERGFMVSTGLG